MNVGNILKVADAIEHASVPGLGFNMGEGVDATGDMPDLSGHSCGTVACVAGWACAVAANGIPKTDNEDNLADWQVIRRQARRMLGLTDDEADELFEPDTDTAIYDANVITPEQAVRCLRNLAITGKVDWEAAMKGDEPVLPPLPVSKSPVKA